MRGRTACFASSRRTRPAVPAASASSTRRHSSRATFVSCSGWFVRTGRGASPHASTARSWRLLIICVVSIVGTVAAIIGAHGLWERAPDPRVRGQVALFNVTTTLTLAIGILCLYLVLFALILVVAELLIGPDVFASALGHPTVTTDYLALAWFSSSFATVAGGLGAGLESREVVREAAYTSSVGDEKAFADAGTGASGPPRG